MPNVYCSAILEVQKNLRQNPLDRTDTALYSRALPVISVKFQCKRGAGFQPEGKTKRYPTGNLYQIVG
jgi:hypothetical protein